MSLIPAKQYYGEDTSDQWQRKKQTKEQKRAAKKAKLDPANQKTAKDVMDENERKRKREMKTEAENEDDGADVEGLEKPLKGLKRGKKQKLADGTAATGGADEQEEAARQKAKSEKRKEKQQLKKQKLAKKKEKAEAKRARKQSQDLADLPTEVKPDAAVAEGGTDGLSGTADLENIDMSGITEDEARPHPKSPSSVSPSPEVDSPAFDISANVSATSSTSSIVPPASASGIENGASGGPIDTSASTNGKKEKAPTLPKINQEELQARLKARIDELRARRRADGIDGEPAKNRQELLAARRRKEEQRKQHKKELRIKAKLEEERLANERLRGSGSPLSADIFSPRSPRPQEVETNFSFGRVAFGDGEEVDSTLSNIIPAHKKKGPQDPKGALAAAQKKAARLSGLDETKRADIEEKDLWLNARKRAHGERVRDDQSLLKKALKRKEKGKAKSEKEWNERIEGVKKGQEMRQKKREDNLAKRREEKGSKGKKAKGGAGKGKGKKKARPGFEGSFKGTAKAK
ncbi:hypothetical protein LTR66_011554 [Elasticomyces elasticus]|nr:hypothetical protein LTR66_011554 [Elasticomyces elasticus]